MEFIDLVDYFKNPKTSGQKRYEAIRTYIVNEASAKEVSDYFGYKESSIYTMVKAAKSGQIQLFVEASKGPTQKRTSETIQKRIVQLRNKNLSVIEIQEKLLEEGITISFKTVSSFLVELGFEKLPRRTNFQLGKINPQKLIPLRSNMLDFETLKPFNVDTPVAGVFQFIPYIIESGIIDIIKELPLPQSSVISSVNACLSILLLKLIGNQRLSHIQSFDMEPGLGVFAGLNVLPKTTYMSTYSCLSSEDLILDLQKKIVTLLKARYPKFYTGKYINLDFHSIPHFGDESEMQKIWCGASGKTMKAANTVIAQDAESNFILYTRSDILTSEQNNEVKKFIEYYKQVNGTITQTLVFDCKFTSYTVLNDIALDKIKFITLRKRNKKLIDAVEEIPASQWVKVKIPIPKRKYQKASVCEQVVTLSSCTEKFRQIIVTDHGRVKPTFIITNDFDLSLEEILIVYAKRWRVENKIAEIVSFFNINALSSPIMIRIHFDMLWTMVADTLYHIFAHDLRRFENNLAPTIFRKFVDFPGKVIFDGDKFIVKIRKRAHTPILLSLDKFANPITLPWLDNRKLLIQWTP